LEKINEKKKRKKGKVGKKIKKYKKRKDECIMDYYCNPRCIGCG
jgi:hypothetical protein